MTVFLDASVFIYAFAGDSPYRASCERIIRAVRDGVIEAETSVAVIEELWHAELRNRPAGLSGVARAAYRAMTPVLPVIDATVARAFQLPQAPLGANDRVHIATCFAHGISTIVTADRGFDGLDGLERIDPLDETAVRRLLNPNARKPRRK